jgi:hypothetical protein
LVYIGINLGVNAASFESRYSQIERKVVSVNWGVDVLAKLSPRIGRWYLRLQQYDFKVVYRPGSTNPADYMSRHPVTSTCTRGRKVKEEYVNYVCELLCSKALSV